MYNPMADPSREVTYDVTVTEIVVKFAFKESEDSTFEMKSVVSVDVPMREAQRIADLVKRRAMGRPITVRIRYHEKYNRITDRQAVYTYTGE